MFYDKEIMINESEWKTAPFRFKLFTLAPSGADYIDVILSGVSPLVLTQAIELNYLKLFGDTEQRNIPSWYTQVEYLESDGTQYIDTGKQFQGNIQIYLDTMYLEPLDSFGWGRNGSSQEIIWYSTQFYFGGGYSLTTEKELNTRYVYDLDFADGAMVAKINGSIVRQTPNSYGTQTSANEIYLFANNNQNTPSKFSARVYLFEIRQGSQLLQRLIPARRNSDSVLGMYDTVSGTFFTNAGTGSFTAGADVTAPSPDYPIDIVCNNGVIKVNTEASGKNAIDTSDITEGYLGIATGEEPRITYDANSDVVRNALTVKAGKKYIVEYTSIVSGRRAYNIVANNIVVQAENIDCVVGLNKYEITANYNGSLWITIQHGSLSQTKPIVYEIGEIYTDGTTETVQVTGKNLFDGQWQVGIYSPSTGEYSATNNRICNANIIKVSPSTYYTVSCPDYDLSTNFRWVFYKADKTFASAITNGATTIQTPANAEYANVYIASNLTVENAPDMQLELGSTATTYEQYFNGGSALAEMLLKVGTYQDQQEVLGGDVTRNVGIKVFDGTENISIFTSSGRTSVFLIHASDTGGLGNGHPSTDILSTHLGASNGTASSSMPNNSIFERGDDALEFFVRQDDYDNNLNGFKQWLADQYNAGTPVIVVYPLAEPTTESVTGQPLTLQQGTNIVEITQASINNLTMEASFKQKKGE